MSSQVTIIVAAPQVVCEARVAEDVCHYAPSECSVVAVEECDVATLQLRIHEDVSWAGRDAPAVELAVGERLREGDPIRWGQQIANDAYRHGVGDSPQYVRCGRPATRLENDVAASLPRLGVAVVIRPYLLLASQ